MIWSGVSPLKDFISCLWKGDFSWVFKSGLIHNRNTLKLSSSCKLEKEKKKTKPVANYIGDKKYKFLKSEIPFFY